MMMVNGNFMVVAFHISTIVSRDEALGISVGLRVSYIPAMVGWRGLGSY